MTDAGNTGTMSGCVSCGAPNEPEARFCVQCGARLPESPQAGGSPRLEALLNDARQHVLMAHWEDAGLAAEGVLTLNPNIAEAHHIAAVSCLRQGMRSAALRHAQRAVEIEPDSADYQSTLVAAQQSSAGALPLTQRPALLASIVAVVAFALVLVLALAGRSRRTASAPITPTTPTSQESPFVQPAGQDMPQPLPSSTSSTVRPRVPVRAAPSLDLTEGTPSAPSGVAAATPVPSGPVASPLATAPVDTSPLRRFAAPETPAAPRQSTQTDQRAETRSATPRRTVAPVPTTSSGTLFGGPVAAREPSSSAAPPQAVEAPVTPVQAAPASPQQHYVQRQYSDAVSGLQRRISSGDASGSNYQQLAMAYQRLGQQASAEQALESAIAAYKAQIQAGQDPEVASRGLRSCEAILRMMRSR